MQDVNGIQQWSREAPVWPSLSFSKALKITWFQSLSAIYCLQSGSSKIICMKPDQWTSPPYEWKRINHCFIGQLLGYSPKPQQLLEIITSLQDCLMTAELLLSGRLVWGIFFLVTLLTNFGGCQGRLKDTGGASCVLQHVAKHSFSSSASMFDGSGLLGQDSIFSGE